MSLPSARVVLLAAAITLIACLAAARGARADPVVMAAGDIACLGCYDYETSNLLVAQRDSAEGLAGVLSLGDNQYPDGSLSDFLAYYDKSWGRVKSLIHPVPGNHDFGSGYYSYFGAAAGPKGKGYYSFDIGSWHLIALNSCYTSCGMGSPQQQWLREDLATHPASCTLAFWHEMPAISDKMSALADDLDAAGVDLVLGGHDHGWHRGTYKGMRTVTVGTGGADGPSSFGVMKLELHPGGYDWRFVEVPGKIGVSGSGQCRGASAPPAADPTPTPSPEPAPESAPADDRERLVVAAADGIANAKSKSSKRNGDPTLDIDERTRAYIRFDVAAIDGNVIAARLRLQSLRSTSAGGDVFPVDADWNESSLTATAAPLLPATPVAGIGAVAKGSVDVPLDAGLFGSGNGAYAFAIASRDRRAASYSSREGRAAPLLLLTVVPAAIVTPPPPPAIPAPEPAPPAALAPGPRSAPRPARRAACRPVRRAEPARRRARPTTKVKPKKEGPRSFVAEAAAKRKPAPRRRTTQGSAQCARPVVKRRVATVRRKPRRRSVLQHRRNP